VAPAKALSKVIIATETGLGVVFPVWHWYRWDVVDQPVNGTKIDSGYVARKKMLVTIPVTYLAMAVVAAVAHRAGVRTFRKVVVAALLVVFLPPFEPAGASAPRRDGAQPAQVDAGRDVQDR
jgi:hypothetical protein